ncbi:hypothetical protein HRR83_008340 [Exophiala dermatitidis]|uniref:Uncharacterized protein n=2 Tax=Exophiala dermatitidis TaxID=5970 RepID=H6C590_EXODN|nr:uncharacterized protein HMPREF1120_07783 [Exophiala dermatitidis NIH/UT8656]KAJ4505448.1 hypothetical protein HRR75_007317 [Exophiala dermatitidis]EHY59801.1 hypothetical protein HMPREF1120_07783 [Exophiala dermatitidis NIH/UT8656]KAJ4507048.1 hypothetical protein HRR73_007869 [Exophiala dermatitidis]KAJ4507644.1 hypothetical protein HRR74_007971 [Exophiala dermatitidis]KAJ4533053.1 hypothetical protein HRR76_008024 [Exophiala dermatitidis]
MEHVCARCARLSLRPASRNASISHLINGRGFSTARSLLAEGDQKPSGNSASKSSASGSGSGSPSVVIRKTPVRSGTAAASAGAGAARRPPPGPILRRTGAQRTGSAQNSPASTGTRTPSIAGQQQQSRAPAPGLLLRRSGPPRSTGAGRAGQQPQQQQPGSYGARRGLGQPQGQGAQQYQRRQGAQAQEQGRGAGGRPINRTDRRIQRAERREVSKAAEEEDEDDADLLSIDDQINAYIKTNIDRPVNPTEEIPHVPGQELSVDTLRADWPNTPLSGTGLTESVQQRIEWLAHRIPHGYQTPMQLAERYYKGYLTRFESEEEKKEVLALAAEIARKRADEITEKKNVEAHPKDMTFDDVASRAAERQALAETYVKGKYPEPEKQKMPFLDQIVRNLNNNDTYNGLQSEQFMQTVHKLMATQAPRSQKRT